MYPEYLLIFIISDLKEAIRNQVKLIIDHQLKSCGEALEDNTTPDNVVIASKQKKATAVYWSSVI